MSIARLLVLVAMLLIALDARADDDRALVRMKTEKRTALVIGNSAYATVSSLRNPKSDATLMAQTLESVGFTVTMVLDADQKQLRRAIQDFGAQLTEGGVSVFYYAGHGIQVNGKNYMVPVDATITGEADVEIEAIDVGAVLAKMSTAKNRVNIVILDACRNNPFARSFRSTAGGLAFTSAPSGTLIAYATEPNNVAADGDGENSPYAEALARHIRMRGLEVATMFNDVRSAVQQKTGEKQTPWESTSLVGRFYFVLPDAGELPPAASSLPPLARVGRPAATAAITQRTVDSSLPRFELGLDTTVWRFFASTKTLPESGTPEFDDLPDGVTYEAMSQSIGFALKYRETETGRGWLAVDLAYGLAVRLDKDEGSSRHGDGGVWFLGAQQLYRLPLSQPYRGKKRLDHRMSLDVGGGAWAGKGDRFLFGAMAGAQLSFYWLHAGPELLLGNETGLNAGLRLGVHVAW